ncbi:MAG: hypothetical protein ACXWVM_35885 [Polyangiales bacterium]
MSLLAPDGTVVPTETKTLPGEDVSILAIKATLTPDQAYTLTWTTWCGPTWTRTFHTTAIAPLPASLGKAVVGPLELPSGGGCDPLGRPIGWSSRGITLDAPPEVTPFLGVSDIDLVVDGEPYTTYPPSWGAFASTAAVSLSTGLSCYAEPVVRHVAIRLRIPNGPTLVTPAADAELHCLDADAGSCPTPDPVDAAAEDSSVVDGDVVDSDALDSDLLGDAAADEAGPATKDDATPDTIKATCATSTKPASWSGLGAVLAFALIARLRRR